MLTNVFTVLWKVSIFQLANGADAVDSDLALSVTHVSVHQLFTYEVIHIDFHRN